MPNTPLGFPYPPLTDAPNVPAAIQALATAIDTYVTKLARGFVAGVLGPASQANLTTLTTVVSLTATVVPGRNYLVIASVNWQKTTGSGTVAGSLLETTSGFSPGLVPSATAASGDLDDGSFSGKWSPNVGQTSATFQINMSSTTTALRVDVNESSISLWDMGTP